MASIADDQMRYLFLIILLQFTNMLFAQGVKELGVKGFTGFIVPHKPTLAPLYRDVPTGFKLTYDVQTTGTKEWQQLYNYPKTGGSFIYLDYGSPDLGKTYALIPHYSFPFTKNKASAAQFLFRIGLGLGYNSVIYDPVVNNKNTVLSTRLSLGATLDLVYTQSISSRVKAEASVSFLHFSNGAMKLPNSGINVLHGNLGLIYQLQRAKPEYLHHDLKEIERPLGITASLSTGIHEAVTIGAGSYPFLVTSLILDKRISRKSRFGAGVDFFFSESLRREVQFDNRLDDNEGIDSKRMGVTLSYELLISKFSFLYQLGVYIYDPYGIFKPYYLRWALRHYFTPRIFSSIGVKSHAAKAEAVEFSFGYKIK